MNTKFTFPAALNQSFDAFHNLDVLSFVGGKPITYREMRDKIFALMAALENEGVRPGDKIALFSTNMPHWGISYLAIVYMGAIVVPILPDFHSNEVNNILKHAEVKGIFVSESLERKLMEIEAPESYFLVYTDDLTVKKNNDRIPFINPAISIQKEYNPAEDDLAAIIYTSGTTGNSKGVMLTHKNIVSNAYASLDLFHVRKHDRFLSVLPLSHTLENTIGFVLPLLVGAQVHYTLKPPVPAALLQALAVVKPNIMLSVPLIIEKIFRNKVKPNFNKNGLIRFLYSIGPIRKKLHAVAGKKLYATFGGELVFFGIGGAKLDKEVEQFLIEAKFPYAIGYGLTETSPLVAGAIPGKTKLESTGVSVEKVEIRINEPDPLTNEGEIWVKGPNVMKGYYKAPESTAEVLTPDGWFKTGDLGKFDENQMLFIRGRKKNVIVKSTGENIYPEEIESVINGFKHVVESVVIEKSGRLVAMVHFNREELEQKYQQFKDDMNEQIDEYLNQLAQELHDYVNSRVNRFSRIQQVVLQPIPFQKTATHKIKRFMYVN